MTTVTVPELKAEAKSLGIVGYSAMRKPELTAAIAAKRALIDQTVSEALGQAESDANKIDTPTPSATPARTLTRAERASQAGSRGVSAQPMDSLSRRLAYWGQHVNTKGEGFTPTPAQARRMRKKSNKARGFTGCTLADYREMRRRMKRAGIMPAAQR